MSVTTPSGRTYIITEEGNIQSGLEAGLYNADGDLIIGWDTLTAAPYYLKVEKDYNYSGTDDYEKNNGSAGNSMYEVLQLLKQRNIITNVSDVKEVLGEGFQEYQKEF